MMISTLKSIVSTMVFIALKQTCFIFINRRALFSPVFYFSGKGGTRKHGVVVASMRSRGMGWCQRTATLFFFSFLLQMCSATVLDCTSTGNNPMLFSISHHLVPPGAECYYWWDRGEITLATNTNNNTSALVMRHTSSSLETSECLPDVSWTQQCSQSQNLMDFSANCRTICASKNSLHGHSPTTKPTDEEGLSNTSIGAIAGIMLLIIGLIGLIFLLYKYKDSIPRTLNCRLIGRTYRAGQRKNNEPGDLNV